MKSFFISLITILLLSNVGLSQINKPAKQVISKDAKGSSILKGFNLNQVNNYGNFTSRYYLNSFKIPIDSKYKLDSVILSSYRNIKWLYDLINFTMIEKTIDEVESSITIMKYDEYGNILDFNQKKTGWSPLTYKIFHNENILDSVIIFKSDINNGNEGEISKTFFKYKNGNIIKREDKGYYFSNTKLLTDYVEDYYYEDGKLDSVKISEYNIYDDKWVNQIYEFKYNSSGFISSLSHKNNYRGYWIYYLIIRNNYENNLLRAEVIESKRYYDDPLEKEKYEYIYNLEGKIALSIGYDSIDSGWNKIRYAEYSYLENVSKIYIPPLPLIDPTGHFYDGVFSPLFIEPINSNEYKLLSDGVIKLKGFEKSSTSDLFEFVGQQTFYYSPVNFNLKTSANKLNKLYTTKLFPNPTVNGLINITGLSVDVESNINLYDLRGSLLKSWIISGQNTSIDVSSIPNGIYLVKVTNVSNSFTQKILIRNQ